MRSCSFGRMTESNDAVDWCPGQLYKAMALYHTPEKVMSIGVPKRAAKSATQTAGLMEAFVESLQAWTSSGATVRLFCF